LLYSFYAAFLPTLGKATIVHGTAHLVEKTISLARFINRAPESQVIVALLKNKA